MAREVGLTQNAILRIWHADGLQPHRAETFKLSTDPLVVEKVHDIVGLYRNPPERGVLCVDENSQIQALDRAQPILPMLPGTPERAAHDDKRRGTLSRYAALDLTSGKVLGALPRRHRALECKTFLKLIDDHVPGGLMSTSCSTTARRIRGRRSSAGWRRTRASCCTARPPRARG